jgi:hypothetical protein
VAVAYLGGAFGRSERRKIFVCAFVRAGREERREDDVDEGRSGDWMKIGEISKKKGHQKILHQRLVSVGEIFSSAPSGNPISPPPRVTTMNETLF